MVYVNGAEILQNHQEQDWNNFLVSDNLRIQHGLGQRDEKF